MDTEWGRARALELLGLAFSWLESEVRNGRWHTILARSLGGLSTLADDMHGRDVARRILIKAPDEAFSVAAINMDRIRLVRRELPSDMELDELFPRYGSAVLELVEQYAGAHIRLVLEGKIDQAWASATSDLSKEEHLAACALVGNVARALNMLDDIAPDRREGPLQVVCVESFRRDNRGTSQAVLDRLHTLRPNDCWMWLHLASGFLGRVPWGGYPFPDY